MSKITFQVDGLSEFMKAVNQMGDVSLKAEVSTWIDALGFQFLEEVQRQIISMAVVDTRRLLNSFVKGGDGNVWRKSSGGLVLEVGTNVEYAEAVNDGYDRVKPSNASGKFKDGTLYRFVPGTWSGDTFVYQKGAKTGMILKAKHVAGRPYFDNAAEIFEAMFQKSFERKLDGWLSRL
jgi:hypothetical protein